MNITCPLCGKTCESDVEISVGQHVQCPFCDKTFAYGVVTVTPSAQAQSCKIPGLTLAGYIIFYILTALSVLGNMCMGNMNIATLSFACLFVAFSLAGNKGANWGRIALSVMCALTILLTLVAGIGVASLFAVVVYAIPLTFIWLPCSNRWYKSKKDSLTK